MKKTLTIGLLLMFASAICATTVTASEVRSTDSELQKTVKISGVVQNAAGEPVLGATILEKGSTSNGTTSAVDGSFTLTVPEGATLAVSYIGYLPVEVKAYDGMIVRLEEDTQAIDEVVVVGFGTQKKANLTGAVSTVDVAKAFDSKPIVDVTKGLQGVVPGLSITFNNADMGTSADIRIRGVSSVNGTNRPLILLDGVEISDLSFVNPDNIANISVLKDASSASIYGTRAAYGVVLITSKDGSEVKDKAQITYSNNFAWNEPIGAPKYATGYDLPKSMEIVMLAQKNTNGGDIEAFGMYYKDIIDPIRNWLDNYWGQDLGEVYVYGRDYIYTPAGVAQFYRVADPQKEMLKTGFQHNHNLSISGNSGKTNYNISMNYYKQDGLLKKATEQSMQRVTANISTNSQIKKWLRIGTKVMYTERVFKYPYGNSGSGNLFTYAMRFPTNFPYGISDGGYDASTGQYINETARGAEGLYFRHGNGFVANYPVQKQRDDYLRIGGNVDITLAKGLTFHGDYTRSTLNYMLNSVAYPVYVANWWSSYSPKYALLNSDNVGRTIVKTAANAFNAYFDYNFTVAKDHDFAIKLGFNSEDYYYNNIGISSDNLFNSDFPILDLTEMSAQSTASEAKRMRASAGFFGRINYSWKDKLLLELSGRYDGSSMFRTDQHWGFFPSGSIGYRLSEEEFMKNQDVISNLKIRASYGAIGNQDIAGSTSNFYPFMTTIGYSRLSSSLSGWIDPANPNSALAYFGMPGVVGSSMTWEKIRTMNVGLDMGFFNNELNVTFEWYQRNTIGMLVPRNQVPSQGGFPSMPKENGGDMRTRGWELQLDYNHTFKGSGLSVYATFTLSDNKSKITKWNNSTNMLTSNYEGKEWGEIWGFKTADHYFTADEAANGVQTVNGVVDINDVYQYELWKGAFRYGEGDVKYVDVNSDGVVDSGSGTVDDHGDLIRIGNTLPRYEYALRLGLAWKGIDFEMLFQGVGKRDFWTTSSLILPFTQSRSMAIYTNQFDYYTPENPDAKFPRPYIGHYGSTVNGLPNNGNNNYYSQTKYLSDFSYLRLKNVTLGYTLPQKWTEKVYIQKARVYFSVQNLLTFDHLDGAIDPELNQNATADTGGRNNPFCRTWSCGLQITF